MALVISPVGTSLLRNFVGAASRGCEYCREVVERFRGEGIEGWDRLSLDCDANRWPDGRLCHFVEGTEVAEALHRFVRDYGPSSCAEVSGIEAIVSSYALDPREVSVLLLPTRSCNSILCSRAIARALRERFRSVEVVDLRYASSEDEFEELVLEVLDKVVSRIVSERKRGSRVFVNATPGFKAETAFLAIASMLAGASAVIYIHEAFRRLVSLPTLPLKLDTGYLRRVLEPFGESRCVDEAVVTQVLSDVEIVDAIDRGVLYRERGRLCVRRWVRKLLSENYVETPNSLQAPSFLG